jgi:hypothetical protein
MKKGSRILSVRNLQGGEGVGLHFQTDDNDFPWVNFHTSIENLVSLGDVPLSLKNAVVRVFAYSHEFNALHALFVREDGVEIQWRMSNPDFSQGDIQFTED